MALGDINFRADNNIDCTIEDATGVKQVATLTVNAQAAVGKGLDVNIQDQTTPALIGNFNKITNSTTLAAEGTEGSYTITVDSPTGISAGSYILIFTPVTERFYFAKAVSILGSVVTMDTPLDSTFPIGSFVDVAIINMNVDGSTTPQVFGLRGPGVIPGVDLTFDITRIIITCITETAVDLSLFGDLARLTRGFMLRERNGETYNIFNVKDNSEIGGIMFDWVPYAATNPAQGIDGFVARLTFAGQDKIGVAKRLAVGEDLEIIIQDDLRGLTRLNVIAEGHVVEN